MFDICYCSLFNIRERMCVLPCSRRRLLLLIEINSAITVDSESEI